MNDDAVAMGTLARRARLSVAGSPARTAPAIRALREVADVFDVTRGVATVVSAPRQVAELSALAKRGDGVVRGVVGKAHAIPGHGARVLAFLGDRLRIAGTEVPGARDGRLALGVALTDRIIDRSDDGRMHRRHDRRL